MKLIFDIGYNVGKFTKACYDKYPDVHVIAVEANPDLCHIEKRDNFRIYNNIASDTDGDEVEFYIDKRQTGISTASLDFMENSRFKKGSKNLKRNSGRWSKPIKVTTVTLDSLIYFHGIPDLIKIDVEGYEHNVIRGLTKKAKDICFEWHEEGYYSLLDSVASLTGLGYKKFGVIGWFDEGDVFEKATFSPKGDPYLEYPKKFYEWKELDMARLINHERRINYGMFFAKA